MLNVPSDDAAYESHHSSANVDAMQSPTATTSDNQLALTAEELDISTVIEQATFFVHDETGVEPEANLECLLQNAMDMPVETKSTEENLGLSVTSLDDPVAQIQLLEEVDSKALTEPNAEIKTEKNADGENEMAKDDELAYKFLPFEDNGLLPSFNNLPQLSETGVDEESCKFKEWYEVVRVKSYNDELLTILPYVVID